MKRSLLKVDKSKPIIKKVKVIDKDGKILAPCTFKRASKVVARKCAKWVGYNKIQLLVNEDDRKRLRKEIIEESNRTCYICGEFIPYDKAPTLDHVIPRKGLGEDVKENLKCCCKRCNDDKSNTSLSEYVDYIDANRDKYPWATDERITYLKALAEEYRTK